MKGDMKEDKNSDRPRAQLYKIYIPGDLSPGICSSLCVGQYEVYTLDKL